MLTSASRLIEINLIRQSSLLTVCMGSFKTRKSKEMLLPSVELQETKREQEKERKRREKLGGRGDLRWGFKGNPFNRSLTPLDFSLSVVIITLLDNDFGTFNGSLGLLLLYFRVGLKLGSENVYICQC